MSRYGTEKEHELELVRQGVRPDIASKLITFLPTAIARMFLKDRARFCETYYWVNSASRQATERRYDQTPVFTAALATVEALKAAEVAQRRLNNVACTSAEMHGIVQAMEKNIKLDAMRFATMIHHTDDQVTGEKSMNSYAAGRPKGATAKKPWWKFW
jgi:hypothetical protein